MGGTLRQTRTQTTWRLPLDPEQSDRDLAQTNEASVDWVHDPEKSNSKAEVILPPSLAPGE